MSRKIIILVMVILPAIIHPCDCEWGGSFMESVSNADLIIHCEIVDYDLYKSKEQGIYPTAMSVVVKKVLFIKDDSFEINDFRVKKKKLLIIGDVSSNCRPSIRSFEIGSSWIMKLNKTKHNYYQIDFSVSNCATNYLIVEDNIVKGNIYGKNQSYESDAEYQEVNIKLFYEAIENLE